MHPIERLRYVARAEGADPSLVAVEAASALASIARSDPAGLVPACRRLISRHLSAGPVWWLSARVLGAPDPVEAARAAAAELEDDATDRHLAAVLPDDGTALVIGWPEVAASALRRRADVELLVAEGGGEGAALARRLSGAGNDVAVVADAGVGAAAVVVDIVVLEAHAAGPTGLLCTPGSHAAAAVAARSGAAVWAVAGTGRVLPSRLWEALLERFDAGGEPWERDSEVVPVDLLDALVGPGGPVEVAEGLASATCPAAPELFRDAG
ncbi:MAG TPA: hypothetical protein VG184_01565 [Acidimicrobiales bacterium]|jgi:hypothetical protein|nr:hypothetical protein [Acidimicrobiales bacterium]